VALKELTGGWGLQRTHERIVAEVSRKCWITESQKDEVDRHLGFTPKKLRKPFSISPPNGRKSADVLRKGTRGVFM
jgi:hypothetical protein